MDQLPFAAFPHDEPLINGDDLLTVGDLTDVSERLKTFVYWPNSLVSVDALARSGFVYLGVGERTQCVYCHAIVKRWTLDDDPKDAHRLERMDWFDYFFAGAFVVCVTITSPLLLVLCLLWIGLTGMPLPTPQGRPTLTRGNLLGQSEWWSKADLLQPYPRLSTFAGWSVKGVSPKKLADSGFYYNPDKKETRCAFCGIIISDWNSGDVPNEKHLKLNPLCRHAVWQSKC